MKILIVYTKIVTAPLPGSSCCQNWVDGFFSLCDISSTVEEAHVAFNFKVDIPNYIDMATVSRSRCDVDSVQTISFHAVWRNGSAVQDGLIYVNGTAYTTNASGWISFTFSSSIVGEKTWKVTNVSCNGITDYIQVVPNPRIIWDRVKIVEGGVTDTVTNVTETETVWFRAIYEYDNAVFDGAKGTLYVNGSAMTWIGTRGRWERDYTYSTSGARSFKISDISDNIYGLTVINDIVGSLSIRWVEYIITITSPEEVTSEKPILINATETLGTFINITGISDETSLIVYNITATEGVESPPWNMEGSGQLRSDLGFKHISLC